MNAKTTEFIESVRKMLILQENEGKMIGTSKELYFTIDKVKDYLAATITFKDPMKCRKCKQNTEGV